ncbi:hypothetical protein VCHENC02_0349B, partial [Vibrio harveyi]
SSKVPFGRI